jgi:hypothetical protein
MRMFEILNNMAPNVRKSIRNVLDSSNALLRFERGFTIPPAGLPGYAPGCEYILPNATLGQCPKWVNIGSSASCLFVPVGPTVGYGFANAGGPVDCTTGSATQRIAYDMINPADIVFVGHAVSDDNDQIAACIAETAKSNILITASADPLTAHDYVWAALRNKCVPGWDIFAAGKHTTVGGGVGEAITVSGVLASDIAFACYSTTNDTDLISDVACTANTVTVTCSADPLTAHVIDYVVLRPRGSFKPSHYVAKAGTYTAVAGDTTTVAITVAGALATDVVMINYATTDDTDTLVQAAVSANTLTLTVSADPVTDHSWNYALLRAY